ncbi:hypothetical protein NKI15_06740 [Mesorhizobium sp. M0862]|uniref:hypothetical protein n=1 Tax=Mesorhizobium sp. M0862 TaxID=2957015 RepID=UPI00333CDADD
MGNPTFRRVVRLWDDATKSIVTREIEINIDVDAVALALAKKAIKNKSKKSKLIAGDIVGALV